MEGGGAEMAGPHLAEVHKALGRVVVVRRGATGSHTGRREQSHHPAAQDPDNHVRLAAAALTMVCIRVAADRDGLAELGPEAWTSLCTKVPAAPAPSPAQWSVPPSDSIQLRF